MPGKQERPAGSRKTGEPAFLAVGKIRRPHGVHGEAMVELYTDFPARLKPGKEVFFGPKHEKLTIRSQRSHQDGLLLGFAGLDTPESVGSLRNQTLFVASKESPLLPDGEYYYHQLLDLVVMDDTGSMLGTLTDILETGANDVYLVTSPSGTEILLPAIPQVIKSVDLDTRQMIVHLIPGLLETDSDQE